MPTLVGNLPTIKHIASGGDHVLAVSADGYDVYSWGCGEKGQLGRDLPWGPEVPKEQKKRALLPGEPAYLRLPAHPGLDAHGRMCRALNENFLHHLRDEARAARAPPARRPPPARMPSPPAARRPVP